MRGAVKRHPGYPIESFACPCLQSLARVRLQVRIAQFGFAGWDFKADEVERPDFAVRGYRDGVPMGGDLNNAPEGNLANESSLERGPVAPRSAPCSPVKTTGPQRT